MAVINLRNVPDELYRHLKSEAGKLGEPFRAHCLRKLAAGSNLQGQKLVAAVHPPLEALVSPGARPLDPEAPVEVFSIEIDLPL